MKCYLIYFTFLSDHQFYRSTIQNIESMCLLFTRTQKSVDFSTRKARFIQLSYLLWNHAVYNAARIESKNSLRQISRNPDLAIWVERSERANGESSIRKDNPERKKGKIHAAAVLKWKEGRKGRGKNLLFLQLVVENVRSNLSPPFFTMRRFFTERNWTRMF